MTEDDDDPDIAYQEMLCRKHNITPQRARYLTAAQDVGVALANGARMSLSERFADREAFTNSVVAMTTMMLAYSRLFGGEEVVPRIAEKSGEWAERVREELRG